MAKIKQGKKRRKKVSYDERVAGVVGSIMPEDFDPEEFESRIESVADVAVYLRLLYYGDPGTEKTRFLASAVKHINPQTGEPYRVLIADCNEQGTLSVRKFDPTKKYLKRVPIKNTLDLEQLFWYLWVRGHKKWDIVGIDTVTELSWLTMRGVIDEDAASDASRDILMPHKRDYGKNAETLRMWISNFRNLPMHVIFTAHEIKEDEEDEDSGRWPDIQKGVRNRLCGAVDIIGRAYHREIRDKMVPCAYFGKHEFWKTKDRSGELPDEMKRPSLGKVIELIQDSTTLKEEQQGKKKKKKSKKSK